MRPSGPHGQPHGFGDPEDGGARHVYDAWINPVDSAGVGDPDSGRVRVLLNGPLAEGPAAADLAAELAKLISTDMSRVEPSAWDATTDELEISLHALGLERELEDAIAAEIRAHIRARVRPIQPADPRATSPSPEADR
jgi:hypothetical protein